MKWSILGLFSLGLIAAVCAAMLVTSVNAGGASPRQGIVRAAPDVPQTTEATILVAARNFEALDVIDASGLVTKTVPQEEVPIGAVAYDAEAIGKVLLRPVEEGEVIVSSLFAGEGSGVHVASALRKGKRAVSVTLTDNMGLEGLLYPGSVVDVLASMAVRDEPGGDERPVSMTLLQGVSVLAVGEQTIVSEGQRSEDSGAPLRQTRRPSRGPQARHAGGQRLAGPAQPGRRRPGRSGGDPHVRTLTHPRDPSREAPGGRHEGRGGRDQDLPGTRPLIPEPPQAPVLPIRGRSAVRSRPRGSAYSLILKRDPSCAFIEVTPPGGA